MSVKRADGEQFNILTCQHAHFNPQLWWQSGLTPVLRSSDFETNVCFLVIARAWVFGYFLVIGGMEFDFIQSNNSLGKSGKRI